MNFVYLAHLKQTFDLSCTHMLVGIRGSLEDLFLPVVPKSCLDPCDSL